MCRFGLFNKRKRLEEPESVVENKQDMIGDKGAVNTQETSKVTYLENPLPVPKRHEKRIMDFTVGEKTDDFDISIDENDDFDV